MSLNANDLRPAYRVLKKPPQVYISANAIQTADGCLISDIDGEMAHWPQYFEQLFTVDSPSRQL